MDRQGGRHPQAGSGSCQKRCKTSRTQRAGLFPALQNSPRHSRASMGNGSEDKARKLRHLWEELFPAEQARTMELLVRLPTRDRGCGSGLRGLVSLVAELRQDA